MVVSLSDRLYAISSMIGMAKLRPGKAVWENLPKRLRAERGCHDGRGDGVHGRRGVLDLPLFSLRHHQQDAVPVAAVAADGDVAGRAVSRGAERALPRGLGQASSGHGGGCALLSRGLEEAARGHGAQGSAGCPRRVSCQGARRLACEGLHRVHHHGRVVCCECRCECVWAASMQLLVLF